MVVDRRGNLDLRRGEELIVRLTSTGALFHERGRVVRWVGRKRGYHFLVAAHRSVRCSWLNCDLCEQGRRRDVRYETRLLLETPNGLEEHTAFLAPREHAEFAKAAEVIVASGREPMDVRLLWKRRRGSERSVEVIIL